ncbi:kinesin-domain-containing protein [Piromyces finnis]|uniref:Kinesin-like protein n=1 Tax=Piromyces finnis TaxID=1754191 RepID=A0A1Y1VK05_9FUNG|nr:kinesin-domain-containing protein [Piromyces finnis]|eukprot:ORX58423.1 kinesin-domain-containing protein [Piromyces finnis]
MLKNNNIQSESSEININNNDSEMKKEKNTSSSKIKTLTLDDEDDDDNDNNKNNDENINEEQSNDNNDNSSTHNDDIKDNVRISDNNEEETSTIKIFSRIRPVKYKVPNRYWITKPEEDVLNNENPLPKIGFLIPRSESQGLINNQKEKHEFKFDKVFDKDTKQEEIFDVVAKDVVLSVLDGYNGTIFAYGQTGSGKTFTITGGAERYEDRGLIPRSLQFIFKEIQKRTDCEYSINISYLEIYNESGYDLLDSSREAKKLEDLPKVSLMEDEDNKIHIRNLASIPAVNEEEALNLLFIGDTNRVISETPSNPESSRSHCIFIVTVVCKRHGHDAIRKSKLHLVDLAGSERVAKTQIGGTLLKEAKYINLSLHYLEQVIIALHEKSLGKRQHIPYRNSMMTSVLRDSLGGNCKTTMIATIAVEPELIEESISTCRFAQRVSLISNKAKLNEEIDPQLVIERLKREIARLKTELAIARGDGEDSNEELPQYEKERVQQDVQNYLSSDLVSNELLYNDYRKIRYAFSIMKNIINEKGVNESQSKSNNIDDEKNIIEVNNENVTVAINNNISNSKLESKNIEINKACERLKKLIAHRDNEINILIGMVNEYKKKVGESNISLNEIRAKSKSSTTTLSSEIYLSLKNKKNNENNYNDEHEEIKGKPNAKNISSSPDSIIDNNDDTNDKNNKKISIILSPEEKIKAYNIFIQTYEPQKWIDKQKLLLKAKYIEAKQLGETANNYRNIIKSLKSKLVNGVDTLTPEEKTKIGSNASEYASKYQKSYCHLKEMKIEIEHIQHLLEKARFKLTKDFEFWILNKYTTDSRIFNTPNKCNYNYFYYNKLYLNIDALLIV